MARLMSQAKGGFYAAAPEAIDAILQRLRPPALGECLVLDPCAGEGLALLQLAQGLDGEPYGIELSEDRAAIVKALLDDQALAPADFFRTMISHGAFSLVFCNPPYDYATGGEGRMERQFVQKAAGLVADGGVLALVCPEDVARDYTTAEFFEERFDQVSALPFPAEVRRYSETVILGRKRKSPVPVGYLSASYDWLDRQLQRHIVYTLPPGARPRMFRKTEPTDAELVRLVAQSPLRFHIDRPADADTEANRPRPPMSPGTGHRAMLLASGHINGLIAPPDEPPHVIRGTASKESYVSACTTEEDEEGNSTTRTVISEKPRLVIRVLDFHGYITTLE